MQQTEKYKLNLIDPNDEFSPEPLNANTRTVDAQLSALADAEATLSDAKAAIQKDVGSGGKNARIFAGTVSFSGGKLSLTFEFRPLAVFLAAAAGTGNPLAAMLTRGTPYVDYLAVYREGSVKWTDNGVDVSGASYLGSRAVNYVAIGESL